MDPEQLKELLAGVGDYVDLRVSRQLAEKTTALEARISEIESKGVVYRGVFQPALDYKRGDIATYAGTIWHANMNTRSVPGRDSSWSLMVKSTGSAA